MIHIGASSLRINGITFMLFGYYTVYSSLFLALGGDCELETMIRALKFITKVLEEESEEVYD